MKKITALLLVLILLFAFTSCDKPDPEPEPQPPVFDKNSALEPKENPSKQTIYDSIVGTDIELAQIVKTDILATETLDLAYQCLAQMKIEDNIISLYNVPLGMAGNYVSYDVIRIDLQNTTDDAIYMVLVRDNEGTALAGWFRQSEVENARYIAAATKVKTAYETALLNEFGFNNEKITVQFPITWLKGLSLKAANDTVQTLYKNTTTAFYKIRLCNVFDWSSEPEYYQDNYCKVSDPNFNSLETMKAYLGTVFTDDIRDDIYKEVTTEPDILYVEANGKLYAAMIGMGGNDRIREINAKYFAETDTKLFMVVEASMQQWSDDYSYIMDSWTEEYLFTYVKANNTWLCNNFTDITFGFYSTI